MNLYRLACGAGLLGWSCLGFAAPAGSVDGTFAGGQGTALVDLSAAAGDSSGSDTHFSANGGIDSKGRIVVASTLEGTTTYGVALTRLRSDGSVDPSFGTQGTAYMPASGNELVSLRIDGADRIVFAYQGGSGASRFWRTCRFTESGQPDGSYFGGSPCASGAPGNSATLQDLVLLSNGNAWMIGTGSVDIAGVPHAAIASALVDQANQVVRTDVFSTNGGRVTAERAVATSSPNQIVVVGTYRADGADNLDVSTYALVSTITGVQWNFVTTVPFNVGGSRDDVPRCLVAMPDGRYLVGVSAAETTGTLLGTVRLTSVLTRDSTYAPSYNLGGLTLDDVTDTGTYGSNLDLRDCTLGADGAASFISNFSFGDPLAAGGTSYIGVVNRKYDDFADLGFGGPNALPGSGLAPQVAIAGSAAHFFRSLALPHPRSDTVRRILALPSGDLIAIGDSLPPGSTHRTIAVMKLNATTLFHDGFED